jgi:hypothetical protein
MLLHLPAVSGQCQHRYLTKLGHPGHTAISFFTSPQAADAQIGACWCSQSRPNQHNKCRA